MDFTLPQEGGTPRTYWPPAELGEEWGICGGQARWLGLAVLRPPWSPEGHAHFPPPFRAAARALLLAAAQQRRGGDTASLGALSQALLHRIVVGLSLYPLSAWSPSM